jgi:hypothetical protein
MGPEQMLLTQTDHGQGDFFRNVPNSLLVHPSFQGWTSSSSLFPKDLPFFCSLISFKYDMISSKKETQNVSSFINEEYVLFEYRTLNLNSNISAVVKANFTMQKKNGIYEGTVQYVLSVNSNSNEEIIVDIEDPLKSNDLKNETKKYKNRVATTHSFLSENYINQGFYQLLSPQTIFFRVSDLYFLLIPGWLRTRFIHIYFPSDHQ